MLMLIFSLSEANSLAQAGQSPSMINPDILKDNEIPQMGTLHVGSESCTAILIGPRTIITAAHCVASDNRQLFGPIGGKSYNAVLTRHPSFIPDRDNLNIPFDFAEKNDLAIGVLESAVDNVSPLTVTRQSPDIGAVVLTLGLGSPSFERQFGYVKVITISPIGVTLRGQGPRHQSAYYGDSGGPNCLIGKDGAIQVFAVTSAGTGEESRYDLWAEAKPYTFGVALVLPNSSKNENSQFVPNFIKQNSLSVCGINLTCPKVLAPKTNEL